MTGRHEELPIDEIQLDTENPRIQHTLLMYGSEKEITTEQIGFALGEDGSKDNPNPDGTTYQSLKEAIKCNGTLISPIIVNRKPDNSIVVIEGNTRLYIYQKLLKEAVPGDWTHIPAIVYEDLEQNKIDAIRLQAHMVGPRDWEPYAKGKYLHHLADEQNMPLPELVHYCNGNQRTVEHYIRAYSDMEKFYRPVTGDEDFERKHFSTFIELQKNANIKSSLVSNQKDETDFSKWVAAGTFSTPKGRAEHVRSIPKILVDDEAQRILISRGSHEALKYLDSLDQNITRLGNATLEQLAKALAQKIRKLDYNEQAVLKQNIDEEPVLSIYGVQNEIESLIKDLEN